METRKPPRPSEPTPRVLVVDDDADDIMMLEWVLSKSELRMTMDHLDDGIHILDYLRGEGRFDGADPVVPDLILLDINMPQMNGLDAARQLKSEPDSQTIPVVMLTTSENPRDVRAAYATGAASYIVKPGNIGDLRTMLDDIHDYWFSTVELPGRS